MYGTKYSIKPCKPVERPPLKSVRLLDREREHIRYVECQVLENPSVVMDDVVANESPLNSGTLVLWRRQSDQFHVDALSTNTF
jgi:hypothetical protein